MAMKKSFLLCILLLACTALGAQTFTEWQDPHINSINRLPMHSSFLAAESQIIPLTGDWSFRWSCRVSGR